VCEPEVGPPTDLQARYLQPDARGTAEEIGEGAGRDGSSPVDDTDAVADMLGLLEKVSVQKTAAPDRERCG